MNKVGWSNAIILAGSWGQGCCPCIVHMVQDNGLMGMGSLRLGTSNSMLEKQGISVVS